MRSASFFLAMFFSAAALSAQSAAPAAPSAAPTIYNLPPTTAGCPIGYAVDRTGSGQLLEAGARSGEHTAPLAGQTVEISFTRSPAAIVAVDLLLHGTGPGTRMIPAGELTPAVDLTESFHLTGTAAAPLLKSPVQAKRPMMITSVELTRIVYANGTVWQSSAASHCAVAPSLFVPVTAGQ